jgi:hypothetical protein
MGYDIWMVDWKHNTFIACDIPVQNDARYLLRKMAWNMLWTHWYNLGIFIYHNK